MAMSDDDLARLRSAMGLPDPTLPTLISEEDLVSAVLLYCEQNNLPPELSRVHLVWGWASYCVAHPAVPASVFRNVRDNILAPLQQTAPALADHIRQLLRSPATDQEGGNQS